MSQSPSDKLLDSQIGFVTTKHDRRRPGRVNINSELLPLFRGTANVDVTAEAAHIADVTQEQAEEAAEALAALDDGGIPARAIVISTLLVIPIWSAIGGFTYWMLR